MVATIVPSGQADIAAGFGDRFNVSWISQKATLVILKLLLLIIGEFSCKVTTSGGGVKVWTRKIKVNVVGRFYLFLNNMQCIRQVYYLFFFVFILSQIMIIAPRQSKTDKN